MVYLEIQGTGMYNPLNSYIKINGIALYDGEFVGLMLMILSRNNLQLVYKNIFNTFNDSTQADLMSETIRLYNSNYFVIIISSYGWETFFNKNLSQSIFEMGGYLTQSLVNPTPQIPKYKYAEPVNCGHPYAFIGIPNQKLISQQSFEVLRNTTQYYNYNNTLYNSIPTARIGVNIVFDFFRQFYFFQSLKNAYLSS
jgi:hypothetical protein